ncbi:hypothetical protein [Bifidobacterium moukalabense]|uniref:hypothetical protein n=1 Tax=Bifidobacterium moukalabense TaxID=1333651 RepID=UPI0010F70C74|nr:hypothetical protein [Bifidobacterium moukalabense]
MGILTKSRLPESLHFRFYSCQEGMTVGDLCSLSWNDVIKAYAIIVGFAPTSVRMWPVTASEFDLPYAVRIDPYDVYAWPELECDIGRPLVSGKAVNVPLEQLKEIGEQPKGRTDPHLDENATATMDRLIDEWQELSSFAEPEGFEPEGFEPEGPGRMYRVFDGHELQGKNIHAKDLRDLLGIEQPAANSLVQGIKLPTFDQTKEVCEKLQCRPCDILSKNPPDYLARLCQPDMKKLVVEYATMKNLDESRARLNVIEETLKPARSTGGKGARLRAILKELSA